jgi:signal transduction histidine kinase
MPEPNPRPLRWRLIFFIQRLISRVAPPLHSIHWKVFIIQMLVLLLPTTYMAFRIRDSIETSYLHSTEEGMIDTATVVAELFARLEAQIGDDPRALGAELERVYANLDQTYQIKARLFGFTRNEVDTRILVFSQAGSVIFDTDHIAPVGSDFSQWHDVAQALRGVYGSRWELDKPGKRVNLFSTVPVFVGGKIIGAVSVAKPTNRVRNFIARALANLAVPIGLALFMAAGFAFLLSGYITRTVRGMADKAERIAAGEPGVRLETWSKSELGMLARSFEKMRRKLEGKAYVEEMATNLSHELKTPLAAIRGAAELLEDGAVEEPAARKKFLGNIQGEVRRLDRLVNDLLTLSRIETHPDDRATADADIVPLVREIAAACAERAESLGIRFTALLPEQPVPVRISPQQLRLLVTGLLDNALQFTPAGRAVTLALEGRELRVTDEGAGIDPEILPKIFNRFFTTENPRTGGRGSGLGLAIAKSIATAHHATIGVTSKPDEGSAFIVRFAL